ncbi:alpha-glucosidase [bacterium A37T11]|nr:alpha-glucosidase [bacterium A37T11]
MVLGFLAIVCSCQFLMAAKRDELMKISSPNGNLTLQVSIDGTIRYSVVLNGECLIQDSELTLQTNLGNFDGSGKLRKHQISLNEGSFKPVIPLKFSTISTDFRQLLLEFKAGYSIEFRVYNEGFAYRFITNLKSDSLNIMHEDFQVNVPKNSVVHMQQTKSFITSYEGFYNHLKVQDWDTTQNMSTLPVLVTTPSGKQLLFSESDLSDYPAMFLKGNGQEGMFGLFPKVPLNFGEDGDRSLKILKEAKYIARTSAKRNFPWRYAVVVSTDSALLTNTMTAKLATNSQLSVTDWIKPGQVSWEWWNGASPYGPEVNFEAGYNLNTYKYFIDFASKYHIPYILMDEGWAKDTRDPYTPNPQVDVHELIRYGKEKNVNIILWLTWLTVEKNMGLFKTFSEWGVKGVKIDFMDRSDQWMVNFYERVAAEAAKYHILVDFHGSFKPAGLEYKYPNVISYEGVRGMEQMSGATPNNNVYLPFMRNAVGPMDYTPGAMLNMQPEVYVSERPNSASIGTRAYQMALYVLFESGLQMLADNPTLYYKNAECTEFITSVPTTWDETKPLKAAVGEYVITAKRKGENWFIGGITNSHESGRLFKIPLNFLAPGKKYKMVLFEDGINAGQQAMDYRTRTIYINGGDTISVKMVKNGGFAAHIMIATGS